MVDNFNISHYCIYKQKKSFINTEMTAERREHTLYINVYVPKDIGKW